MSNDEKEMFDIWDYLTEYGIATDDEISLATTLIGRNVQTLRQVLYIRTGYNSLDQIFDELEMK